ncbi:MAG: hypothetical protein RLZZ301_42 [Bacteroidota bacterium]|jgi:hypothetical protein
MKKNMGKTDRLLRVVVAVVLMVLSLSGVLTGLVSTIALIVALIFTLTALVSFCPLYTLFGLTTCKKN